MNKSFESYLVAASSVLIVLPEKPEYDEVAAGLSLYLALQESKKALIYSSSEMTVNFNRLVGVNKIKSELSGNNLIIQFKNYDGKNIDLVSADMETGTFQLTVTPKDGAPPPSKNDIAITKSGVAADTVIFVAGDESRFPLLKTPGLVGKTLLHIGTKQINSEKPALLSFARPASSHSEVVGSVFLANTPDGEKKVLQLSPDIASNLLTGIDASTNSFSSKIVSADTFYIASILMRSGAKRLTQDIPLASQFPEGSIPQANTTNNGNKIKNDNVVSQNNNKKYHKQRYQKGSYTKNKFKKSGKPQKQQRNQTPQDWLNKPKILKGGYKQNIS